MINRFIYSSLLPLLFLSSLCHGAVLGTLPASETKKIVAVDPGHGGQDTGVKGTGGSLEKNITLSFAKTLESRLSQTYTVLLCRTADEMSDSWNRVDSANKGKADILISIHTGGSYIHEPHGIGIYYHEPSSKPQPAKTNVKSSYSGEKPKENTEPVLWNSVQEKYSVFSRSLATALYERLAKNQSHGKVRLTGLPLFGLSGANMPAVMIEIGELNNPADEKILNSPSALSTLADEISIGINDFFSRYSAPNRQDIK